jgi:NADH-quinone oxidoreductase subunit L
MGGLKKYLPITFATMLVGWLAISGFPLTAGFFSKDEILFRTWSTEVFAPEWGSLGRVLWGIAVLTALLTAVYMTRLMVMTFWGKERFGGDHASHADAHSSTEGPAHAHHGKPHESPAVMWAPLVILAALSIVGGFVGVPPALSSLVGIHSENHFEHFVEPSIGKSVVIPSGIGGAAVPEPHGAITSPVPPSQGVVPAAAAHHDPSVERLFTVISTVVALLGLLLGWVMFTRQPLRQMPRILLCRRDLRGHSDWTHRECLARIPLEGV